MTEQAQQNQNQEKQLYEEDQQQEEENEEDNEEKKTQNMETQISKKLKPFEKKLQKTQMNLEQKPSTWEQILPDQIQKLREEIRQKYDINKKGKQTMPVLFYQWNDELEQKAKEMISQDMNLLEEEQYQKIDKQNNIQWNKFYKHHKLGFFHNRHYLYKEFQELVAMNNPENKENSFIMCELGCGVGDTIYPLMPQYPTIKKFYASDFSQKAIEWVKKAPSYDPEKIIATIQDLVNDPFPVEFYPAADIVTLIFVLSAIAPENHQMVIQKIFNWMKEDSVIYFRDYGLYDFAQLNFSRKKGRKLKDNFYVKHDGTRVYYFSKEEISSYFINAGFEEIENNVHNRYLENRKTGLQMY
ncbi:methyltransferase like 6, putative, partial [Ichthyophthirius multifiliis]